MITFTDEMNHVLSEVQPNIVEWFKEMIESGINDSVIANNDFLKSVITQFHNNGHLSKKQIESSAKCFNTIMKSAALRDLYEKGDEVDFPNAKLVDISYAVRYNFYGALDSILCVTFAFGDFTILVESNRKSFSEFFNDEKFLVDGKISGNFYFDLHGVIKGVKRLTIVLSGNKFKYVHNQ